MKANAKVTNAIRNIIGAAYGDASLDDIKNALLDIELAVMEQEEQERYKSDIEAYEAEISEDVSEPVESEDDISEDFAVKSMARLKRRKTDAKKALRNYRKSLIKYPADSTHCCIPEVRVVRENPDKEWRGGFFGNGTADLHRYSKNKIFYSDPLDSHKTNIKRQGRKAHAWIPGPSMDWKHSDKQRIERMDYEEKAYLAGEDDYEAIA